MRRSRVPGVCAALACAATALCGSGAGASVSRPHRSLVDGSVNGAAAADGGHLVAWSDGAGGVTVLDDRAGIRTDVPLDRPCDRVYVLDGSDGLFLVDCRVTGPAGNETHQLVLDADHGDVSDLVGSGYTRIGRYWVKGTLDAAGRENVVYTNWHTGESRLYRTPRAD